MERNLIDRRYELRAFVGGGGMADVFLAAFPALVTELGIVFAQGPPMQLEPVAVLDTPSLEAKRSLLIVELAVHDVSDRPAAHGQRPTR